MTKLIAQASCAIQATSAKVWGALTKPELIRQYMFGTTVVTDWKAGSPIVWKGEMQGNSYEDKGTILRIEEERLLEYTHFSPLSGLPDVPENYHTVTIRIENFGSRTAVKLEQDNNDTEEERGHSEQMWNSMLAGLKELLEKQPVLSTRR